MIERKGVFNEGEGLLEDFSFYLLFLYYKRNGTVKLIACAQHFAGRHFSRQQCGSQKKCHDGKKSHTAEL